MKPLALAAKAALATLIALASCPPADAAGGRYWLSVPLDRSAADAEFKGLLAEFRKTPSILENTQVFKVYGGIVGLLSDDVMKDLFQLLQEHHVALAMEMPPLSKNNWNNCGSTSEGFTTRAQIQGWMRRIKNNGGELAYLAMDEPLYYGHIYAGGPGRPAGCQVPIAELARDAASNLQEVRKAFPGIHVGDIEPVSFYASGPSPSRSEWTEWSEAFRAAWGAPMEFFHYDLPNSARAVDGLGEFAKFVQATVPVQGFILDAAPGIQGDAEWFHSAIGRSDLLMPYIRTLGADVIIQEWKPFPRTLYPASAPYSFLAFFSAQLRRAREDHPLLPHVFLVGANHPLDRSLRPFNAATDTTGYRETSVFLYSRAGDRPDLVEIVAGRPAQGAAGQLLMVKGHPGPADLVAAPRREHLGFALPPDAAEGIPLYGACNLETHQFLYTLVSAEYEALPGRTWRKDGVIFRFPRL